MELLASVLLDCFLMFLLFYAFLHDFEAFLVKSLYGSDEFCVQFLVLLDSLAHLVPFRPRFAREMPGTGCAYLVLLEYFCSVRRPLSVFFLLLFT